MGFDRLNELLRVLVGLIMGCTRGFMGVMSSGGV